MADRRFHRERAACDPGMPPLILSISLAVVVACSQQVYSPPTQSLPLGPVLAPPAGRGALDVEASHHSQIFDPGVNTGAARVRVGVGSNAEVSAEGMAAMVDDSGPSRASRWFGAGRAGFRINPGNPNVSLSVGAGGGYGPAGGPFAAADAGIALAIHNCVLVPTVATSGFASAPLDPRPVDVTDGDDDMPQFDRPRRTIGAAVRLGVRVPLSRSACLAGRGAPWLAAGLSSVWLTDGDSSAQLPGFGLGLEFPL